MQVSIHQDHLFIDREDVSGTCWQTCRDGSTCKAATNEKAVTVGNAHIMTGRAPCNVHNLAAGPTDGSAIRKHQTSMSDIRYLSDIPLCTSES